MTIKTFKGSVNQSTTIRIVDATTRIPETAVTSATPGISLQYRREGAANTPITLSDLSALTDAHSDGGMLHIGNGYYRLDVPDAAFVTGSSGVLIHGTATDMVVIGSYHQLEDSIVPRKNIALSTAPFLMVDSSGAALPGLTITAEVSKDGVGLAAAAGSATEIGNGLYYFNATAADMNADVVVFRFTGTGARPRFVAYNTIDG